MFKQKLVLEHKIGDRLYEVHCQPDSPLGELFDALMAWKGWAVQRMSQAHEQEMLEAQEKMAEEPRQCVEEGLEEADDNQ